MYFACQPPSGPRYRFSWSRMPRITAGMTASSLPANTTAYSAAAAGSSTAISGTELTLRLNAKSVPTSTDQFACRVFDTGTAVS